MSVEAANLTAENTSRTIEVPSGTIHYHEAGPADAAPIVLLHGSGPGATAWSNYKDNLPALARRFRVLAPDQTGWGKSSPVTFEDRDHVQLLVELLDAWGIQRTAVVGNSMGGGTALRFAALHPDRVSHVITMGAGAAGPNIHTPAGLTEGLRILREAYVDPSPETMRRLVEVMTFAPGFATDELVKERSANARRGQVHLDNFIAGMAKGRRFQASAEQLAGIQAPTMIIHGRDDRVVPLEGSLRLVSLIKNARAVILNQCGHWAQLEHADEFNRLVADFVAHA